MGKTHDPLSLRIHPSLLADFQEEIDKGHDIQPLPPELLAVDLIVANPKYGVFKKVLWEEAKRVHKERKQTCSQVPKEK